MKIMKTALTLKWNDENICNFGICKVEQRSLKACFCFWLRFLVFEKHLKKDISTEIIHMAEQIH